MWQRLLSVARVRGRTRAGALAGLAALLLVSAIAGLAVLSGGSARLDPTGGPGGSAAGLESATAVALATGTEPGAGTPQGDGTDVGSAATVSADPSTGDPTPTPATAGAQSTASATRPASAGATPRPTASATASATPRPTATPAATATPRPTATPTPRPTATPRPTTAAACRIFPASNVWNADVSRLPVARNSAAMISAIGLSRGLHPDFSATGYGIPYNVVGASTARVSVRFDYADESDRGPYPIPANPRIEGGSDRHLLMVDTTACKLYELFAASRTSSGWTAGSGAIWDMRSNALRPAGWTSADAAGLPIFPGLVRYDEVATGAIRHALRFTAPSTCAGYVYPARHQAGSGSCATRPPMGLRVRLKASVDISKFEPQSRVVLQALKRYGMLLADNGSPWYVTGAPDSRWNDDELHDLGRITGADFEVVDTSGLVNG